MIHHSTPRPRPSPETQRLGSPRVEANRPLTRPHAAQLALVRQLDPGHKIVEQPERCYLCGAMGINRVMLLTIPHFQEIVLLAFHCAACGYRTSEVKSGGAIGSHGRVLELTVSDPAEDLTRSVLKSDTASVFIPEIGLEVREGTLGGRFTTIEGLLNDFHDQLAASSPFLAGDSSTLSSRRDRDAFLAQLDDLRTGKRFPFTLIIRDPLAASYIQNPCAPDDDPQLKVCDYQRSRQEDDALGITDMCTDPKDYLSPEDYARYLASVGSGEGAKPSSPPGQR